ncbi:hypothetical protein OE88DRAFT_1661038 [Heliocybe sulcata]|uniref:Uncharacterized protein n=1 Tax=Heliocybe sulcata TaxID=5364 RepID=A0A5C3N0I5_9AGAM|nr:hypothetical protein OE88DRAFT_1661038 [Heliocybe sulcata]
METEKPQRVGENCVQHALPLYRCGFLWLLAVWHGCGTALLPHMGIFCLGGGLRWSPIYPGYPIISTRSGPRHLIFQTGVAGGGSHVVIAVAQPS